MSRMRNRLACATGSVPKINNKYFALPMHTSQALLNVSATVNAVELEFTFRSICLLMCLETGAYSECRMMRSIVSNHSHMVRIFSVRILAVGSHRRFAVCGSHFRVRQFAVRILEQPGRWLDFGVSVKGGGVGVVWRFVYCGLFSRYAGLGLRV